MYLRNRTYSLIVGTANEAVEITNLQIKFKVVKVSDNKDRKNTAFVEIYNLSPEHRKHLEREYVQVSLSVGWSDGDLVNLFQGQVTNVSSSRIPFSNSSRIGTDIITRLQVDEMYETLNMSIMSTLIPSGLTVRDVIDRLVRDNPTIARHEISGSAVNTSLPSGYPIIGTPKQVLSNLSRAYGIEWQIDNGVLYVGDSSGYYATDSSSVLSFGMWSGLVDRPEYINEDAKRSLKKAGGEDPDKPMRKNSIKVKVLMAPSVIAGKVIHLDFEDLTGYYKVSEVEHEGDFRGNAWYSTLLCTERID